MTVYYINVFQVVQLMKEAQA